MEAPAEPGSIQSLGWDELVAQKRKLAAELKELTDRLVDIDRNQLRVVGSGIKEHKAAHDAAAERSKQVRADIDKHNAELLAVSEKITQSKNFLSMMEARLPPENEQDLQAAITSNQALIDDRKFKGEREKSEILARMKDASMKIEAIKAVRTIKEKFAQLAQESESIGGSIKALTEERETLRAKMAEANAAMDVLYDSKRRLAAEREKHLSAYGVLIRQFEAINARLDEMSAMRKKQREEYGYNVPSDALFKLKETAKKKLEEGGKLSFDELKLLYSEKD